MAQKLDPTSALIAGTAALLGISMAVKKLRGEEPSDAQIKGLAAAVFGLIAYDRWHDGMWPFADEERAAVAFANPG